MFVTSCRHEPRLILIVRQRRMSHTPTRQNEEFIQPIIGLDVSYVWRGAGTAIFLELGKLSAETRPRGQATIWIEWSWRIEDHNKVLLGSFSADSEIEAISKMLEGSTVTNITFFGHIYEIDVLLSNGLRLTSYTTVEGDPEWTIRVGTTHMCIKSGNFIYESAV